MTTCDMCGKKEDKDNPTRNLSLGWGFSDSYDLCLMCRQGIKGDIEKYRNRGEHISEVTPEEEKELLK